MAKVLCVLYPDPEGGYPLDMPEIAFRLSTDRPTARLRRSRTEIWGFTPGELVGCVSGELGLRSYLEKLGRDLIVTSDKKGPEAEFEKHLPDAEVVISQPFWPAYLTSERIAKAKKLKLALTAGIGSDHVDLEAAARRHITVAEVTGSNSISVAEQKVRAATSGKGADVVFDLVGGSVMFRSAVNCLALRGRLVEIAATGQREVSFDLSDFYHNESRLFGVDTLKRDLAASAEVLDALTPGFVAGDYRAAPIAETCGLGEAQEAYRKVAAGAAGRIVLRPQE